MKYIGYDVSVMGNHEFTSLDAMSSIYDYLENDTTLTLHPVLAANLYNSTELTLPRPYHKISSWAMERRIASWDGEIRTARAGTCRNTGITSQRQHAVVEKIRPPDEADGCDFIILSYHSSGSTCGDLSLGVNGNQIARLSRTPPGSIGHRRPDLHGLLNDTFKNAAGDDVLVVNGGGYS
jgi:hypothetical protein